MSPGAKASLACPPPGHRSPLTLASVSQPLIPFLLPKPGPAQPPVSSAGGISSSDTDDDSHHLRAYVLDVLSAAPQHAKSRCQGYWSEGRPVARGDRRLLTGQQLAQEIKVRTTPRKDQQTPPGPLPTLTPSDDVSAEPLRLDGEDGARVHLSGRGREFPRRIQGQEGGKVEVPWDGDEE